MDLHVYTFCDADDADFGSFYTQDIEEARTYAKENRVRIIDNTYEWANQELLEDYSDSDEDDEEDEDGEQP